MISYMYKERLYLILKRTEYFYANILVQWIWKSKWKWSENKSRVIVSVSLLNLMIGQTPE